MELKDNTAYLYISNHLEFTWNLPTHVDVIYRESGVEANLETTNEKNGNTGKTVAEHVQEIPFRNKKGMIGFRAHPGQGAIIRGLKIEPL